MSKSAEQLIDEGETIANEFRDKVLSLYATFEKDCTAYMTTLRDANLSSAAQSSIANGFLRRMVEVQKELSK